jgi:hypothetical protein
LFEHFPPVQATAPLQIELQLPAGFEAFEAGRAFVSLIDHRLADASAQVLAGLQAERVQCRPGGTLHFELPWTPQALAMAACGLQAHVSRSGEVAWARGDLATTQSIPVAVGAREVRARLTLL